MTLMNIYPKDDNTFLIDPMSVTGVHYSEQQRGIFISDSKGQITGLMCKPEDAAAFVEKLARHGNSLFTFTEQRFPGDRYYFAPRAVNLLTIAAKEDGKTALDVCVDGVGAHFLCAEKVEAAEAAQLLALVKKEKNLLAFESGDLRIRGGKPDAIYMDPRSLLRVEAHNDRITLGIAWNGRTEIELDRYHLDRWMDRSKDLRDGATLSAELNRASALKSTHNAEIQAAGNAFAAKLAATNPALVPVPGAQYPVFVRPGDYEFIGTHNHNNGGTTRYYLSLSTRDRNGTDPVQACFETAEERDQAVSFMQAIKDDKMPKAAGPALNP